MNSIDFGEFSMKARRRSMLEAGEGAPTVASKYFKAASIESPSRRKGLSGIHKTPPE